MVDEIALPDVDDDTNALANHLLTQLRARQGRNLLRASYYDGKRALAEMSPVVPPAYNHMGIVLGWSAKAVDILARRCNLDAFIWPDGDLDSLGARDVFDGNQMLAETSSAIVSSLIHGVSFLVNSDGNTDDGEPAALIHVHDATQATGDWNLRARRLDNFLVVHTWAKGHPVEVTLYVPGETITARRDRPEPASAWEIVERTVHQWRVPVEPLVYKPRVGRPLGSSRISRTVMGLHDQALRTVIRLEGHMDVYSYPEMWMLGADQSIFKNADGSQKANWQIMLGRIKGIPDDDDAANPRADVKQFPAASPMPHLDALKQQAQLFSGETSIPLTSLGVSDMTNPTSADSYVASREDLIAEAEGATDDWAPPLRRAFTRALATANGIKSDADIPAEWRSIDAQWRSPMYLSRAAQADAGMKVLTAAPWLANTQVGLELLGLDEQQVRRASAEQRRARALATVTALNTPPPQPAAQADGDIAQ